MRTARRGRRAAVPAPRRAQGHRRRRRATPPRRRCGAVEQHGAERSRRTRPAHGRRTRPSSARTGSSGWLGAGASARGFVSTLPGRSASAGRARPGASWRADRREPAASTSSDRCQVSVDARVRSGHLRVERGARPAGQCVGAGSTCAVLGVPGAVARVDRDAQLVGRPPGTPCDQGRLLSPRVGRRGPRLGDGLPQHAASAASRSVTAGCPLLSGSGSSCVAGLRRAARRPAPGWRSALASSADRAGELLVDPDRDDALVQLVVGQPCAPGCAVVRARHLLGQGRQLASVRRSGRRRSRQTRPGSGCTPVSDQPTTQRQRQGRHPPRGGRHRALRTVTGAFLRRSGGLDAARRRPGRRPMQERGVPQRGSADPRRARPRYQDRTDRRLDHACPGRAGSAAACATPGSSTGANRRLRPLHDDLGQPGGRASTRSAGHLAAAARPAAATGRTGRPARPAPSASAASSCASAMRW